MFIEDLLLRPGDDAPWLEGTDQTGRTFDLAQYVGRWAIVWWFPSTYRTGCATCASTFGLLLPNFHSLDCFPIGVTMSSTPEANAEFAAQTGAGLPIFNVSIDVADIWKTRRPKGDIWRDLLPLKAAYLIDPAQKVSRVYQTMASPADVRQIYNDLVALQEPKTLKTRAKALVGRRKTR